MAWQARLGLASSGQARLGVVGCDLAWQARLGSVR